MPTTTPTIPDAITLTLRPYEVGCLLVDLIKALDQAGDLEDLTALLTDSDELVRVASLGRSIAAVAEAMAQDGAYWHHGEDAAGDTSDTTTTPEHPATACPHCAAPETEAGLCPTCDRIPY